MTDYLKITLVSIVIIIIISCNETKSTIGKCKITYDDNHFLGTDSCISGLSKDVFLQRLTKRDSMFIVYNYPTFDSIDLYLNDT